jgi:alpha-beta hydrolase superfamily lysophospholipase
MTLPQQQAQKAPQATTPPHARCIETNPVFTLWQWSAPSHAGLALVQPVVPLLIHGLGGCMAWQTEFVHALLAHYPHVLGVDVSLYGPNPTEVGQFDSHQQLTQAIQQALTQAQQHMNMPILPIGLSLGGLIATHTVANMRVPGLVLISPAFKAAAASFNLGVIAKVVFKALLTQDTVPMSIPYNIEGITSNPVSRALLHNTPGCVQKLPPKSFYQLLKLTLAPLPYTQLNYPLLLLRPQQDTICDTKAMDVVWQRWPHPNRQRHIYPEAYHDLTLETVHPQVAQSIAQWSASLVNMPC